MCFKKLHTTLPWNLSGESHNCNFNATVGATVSFIITRRGDPETRRENDSSQSIDESSKIRFAMASTGSDLESFLSPLYVDDSLVLRLSRDLCTTFKQLSAESKDQFLPTPISESILRRTDGADHGR